MEVQQDMDDIPTHRNSEKYSQRKSKKPLMEKRRRARINSCLMQLKGLVLQAMKKDTSHYSKLEKADILEMTVKHLRMLQRRQISSAVAADPTVATKYNVGFTECATEVMRYLSSVQGVNEDVRSRIIGHLDNCMQSVNTTPMLQHTVQPIHVQIPSNQNDTSAPHSLFPTDRLLVQTTPRQPHSLPNRPQHNGIHMVGPQPSNMHVQGALELLQGSAFNGPVAVYLGHSGDIQNMYSVSPPQTAQLNSSSHKNIDSLSSGRCNTSPNFQTPLGHCGQSSGQKFASQSSSPVFSPALCALKEERVWRPW